MPNKGKPFVSGDPRAKPGPGRPKGLAAFIREQTDDLCEVAKFALKVLRGKRIKLGDDEVTPSLRDAQWAAEYLTEHGGGRLPQSVEVTLGVSDARERLLARAAALLAARDGAGSPGGSVGG